MTDVSPDEHSASRAPDDGAGESGDVDDVDEASQESFPASDAPEGWSGPPGT